MSTRLTHSPLAWIALFACLCLLIPQLYESPAAGKRKSYGRATLLIGKTKGDKVVGFKVFNNKEPELEKKVLFLQSEANSPCTLLVFAWDRAAGKLYSDWLPHLAELGNWDPKSSPPNQLDWRPRTGDSPFEICAAFLPPDHPDLDRLNTLVTAMNPGVSVGVLKLQAAKLKELFDSWAAGLTENIPRAAAPEADAGATFRAPGNGVDDFPWREAATRSDFSTGSPGLLIFEVGGAPAK